MSEQVERGEYDEILRRIGGSREAFTNALNRDAKSDLNA